MAANITFSQRIKNIGDYLGKVAGKHPYVAGMLGVFAVLGGYAGLARDKYENNAQNDLVNISSEMAMHQSVAMHNGPQFPRLAGHNVNCSGAMYDGAISCTPGRGVG